MKMAFSAVFLGCAFFSISCVAYGQNVTDKVDRFTGVRTILYGNPADALEDAPKIASAIRVKDGVPSASIAIFTVSYSGGRSRSSWRYLRCHSVNWLVDNQPMKLPSVVHRGEVIHGGVEERLFQSLSVDDLRKMASAELVEYKICNDEYKFQSLDMEGLRELIQTLDASGHEDDASEVPAVDEGGL